MGPGLEDGEEVALVGDGEEDAFGPGGEDVREGDAGLADGGGVDEGEELVDVGGEEGVEELLGAGGGREERRIEIYVDVCEKDIELKSKSMAMTRKSRQKKQGSNPGRGHTPGHTRHLHTTFTHDIHPPSYTPARSHPANCRDR